MTHRNESFLTKEIVRIIIGINVIMYLMSLVIYPMSLNLRSPFNAFSPNMESLLLLGASGTIPIDRFGWWWTLMSANFLHGSLVHILFNMIALNQLGRLTIQLYGPFRFFVIYALAGILGYYVSYIMGVRFTIGASAAVCGLIGATLFYTVHRGGVIGQVLFRQVSGWLVGLILIGLMPGINNWGHVGGLVSGALFGALFGYSEKREESWVDRGLAGFLGIAAFLTVTFTLGSAVISRLAS